MITTTITANDFIDWMRTSDTYKDQFSYNGARALFDYLDELSDELESSYEFDPVAWCVEFTEYRDFKTFQHDTGYDNINDLDELRDNATVIEFDGGLIIQDF